MPTRVGKASSHPIRRSHSGYRFGFCRSSRHLAWAFDRTDCNRLLIALDFAPAMWTPIDSQSHLPAIGTRESPTLDFKKASTSDAFEIAKDAAAFANAQGGTFLVGAAGGDHLVRFDPLDLKTAKSVARTYEVAIRDRCKPAPLFTVKDIAVDGGAVIVVNVWPFPKQVVGVSLSKTETSIEGAYYFPLRVGTDTKPVTPQQIPMFMDASRAARLDFDRVRSEVRTDRDLDLVLGVYEWDRHGKVFQPSHPRVVLGGNINEYQFDVWFPEENGKTVSIPRAQRVPGELRRRQTRFFRDALDGDRDGEVSQALAAELFVTIDRPKHRTFADAGEPEPVLERTHRACRGAAPVCDHLQEAGAFLGGLASAHKSLEAFGHERDVVAVERDELAAARSRRRSRA